MPLSKDTLQVALSVAGSDPSGGAGIQADVKTFTAIGVYSGAAITSLTVQNTRGVFAVQPVDPVFVGKQIDTVLRDLAVSHIKIGMLGSAAVALSVCDTLADFNGEIIYDPVLVSSSGQQLIDKEGYGGFREQLLNICTVITPNITELSHLTGHDCSAKKDLGKAAEKLLRQYEKLRCVIITGVSFEQGNDFITDYLFTAADSSCPAGCREISHRYISSSNTHGTGCTFSAAFTAYHLLTGDDAVSFQKAVSYMESIIQKSARVRVGHGTGPLLHHLR